MEQWILNLGWKKIAVLLVFISFVFIFLIFSSFGVPQEKKVVPPTNELPTQVPSKSAAIPTSELTTNKAQPKKTAYENLFFSFIYPDNYSISVGKLDQEGDIVTISGPDSTKYFQIQFFPYSKESEDRLTATFSALKYVRSNTTVAGVSALKFNGSFTVGNKTSQESAYILNNSGRLVKIITSYNSGTVNEVAEQEFSQILGSLKLK